MWVCVCSAQQIPQTLPQDEQATNPAASGAVESSSNPRPADDGATTNNDAGNPEQQQNTVQYGASGAVDQFYPNLAADAPFTQLGVSTGQARPATGLKLGPFVLGNISDSFFYAVDTAPGQGTQTLAGDTLSATIGAHKEIGRGELNFLAKEQFSLSGTQPSFNQLADLGYTNQLTERWSLSAGVSLIYFQNYVLANPQYLLQPQNGGFVQQSLLADKLGNTTYISNNFSFSYTISGRTQISFTPVLSLNALQESGGWSFVTNVGGGVAVNHTFNDTLTGGVYYSLTHSFTGGGSNTSSGFNSQSLGVSLRKTYGSWSFGGSLAASFESASLAAWTPTGNLYVSKSFHWNGKASAAYSRTQAAQIYASAGYFDQADIVYRQPLGQKAGLSVSAGEFRTINNTTHATGKRAGTSFSYLLLPRLSLNAGYNYSHQTGASTTFFQGTTNYFTIGLNWILGSGS